jgi:glutamate-1-semialdehyde 2,1-aminomutase
MLEVGLRSQALSERAWRAIPGGVNSARRRTASPINVRRSAGAIVEDLDGRQFIDFHQAYSAVVLGHAFPEVADAVAKAIRERVLVGLGVTEAEVELAERLVRHLPSAEQAVIVNSGSEATFNAIRLSRGVTGREKILKFQGCYHGSHDYALRNALTNPSAPATTEAEYGGVLPAATERVLVCRYNDLDDVREHFARHGDDIAAVIVEPIAHNSPNILPRPGFLEGLREITADHGSILIFDEVITGFRHGLGGYQAICGITPDLTSIGKAMANGFPVAALVGPRHLMERFATHPDGDVFFAGTYNGNSVAVTAALATLDVLEREGSYEHLYRLGGRMRDGLRAIGAEFDVPTRVTGFGSIYTLVFIDREIESADDVQHADPDLFVRYRQQLLARGVIELPVPFVRTQVTLSHTDEHVDAALERSREALRAALDAKAPAAGGAEEDWVPSR